jgi:acyl-CoA synthetase (AMP-forming)/AMP-acid ligase II
MCGATVLPVSVFDARTVMAAIEREKITHLPGSPTMFWAVLDDPERSKYDLSSLRAALISAATIPKELIYRIRDELRIEKVISGYGLTENHAIVTTVLADDPPEIVATTIGCAIDGIEVRVVDDDGLEAPLGQPGELHIRGYALMSGYYDEPEVTANTIVDGWLHTGDIVSKDEKGYLRFVDRKKDMVIVGGFNVSTAEVEKALTGFEKIGQVAVVGAPDHHYGEVVVAFVLPKPGIVLTAEEVIAYAKENMANYKVPRRVEFITELPLNATGKVVKGELRKLL